MGRFILLMREQQEKKIPPYSEKLEKLLDKEDRRVLQELREVINNVDSSLTKFRFADAGEVIYQFMWHDLADKYIEHVKNREDKEVALSVLTHVFITSLKLLHPFMPFVTEEIYQHMPEHGESIMITTYPESI